MYHPYKDGYSVLPGLFKLGSDPVFQVDEHLPEFLVAKQAITHQPYHEHDLDPKIMSAVCQFMHDRLIVENPHFKPTLDFSEIAKQIQEDLVIHRITEDRDWMAACHVSLPGGWKPEEKIGKNFEAIHQPVPGMKSTKTLVRSMLHGPFYRFVWGVRFAWELNSYPGYPRTKFTGSEPVWVKVERQVIYGFPELETTLFVIRLHLVEPDMPSLKNAVLGMTPEQRAYKDIPDNFVEWLSLAVP